MAPDYDYTLCHYKEELQYLIYAMARDYLVCTGAWVVRVAAV